MNPFFVVELGLSYVSYVNVRERRLNTTDRLRM
jgi:hypothetical protein